MDFRYHRLLYECVACWYYFPSSSRKQDNADYIIDRTGERFFHIAGWWWAVILGYIIGLTTMSTGGRYVAMFLMAAGYAGAICS